MLADDMDDFVKLKSDFAHLARLAAQGSHADVRLFLARLVRRYRTSLPELSLQLEDYLKGAQTRAGSPLRREAPGVSGASGEATLPIDTESRLSLIKVYDDMGGYEPPLLSLDLRQRLELIIRERENVALLKENGVGLSKTAIFVGKPGVGKTITARWLAYKLGRPLWVLDLTAVMSSLLGRTGNNLRKAIDYAKEHNAVLLLDEIDAIAKRRSDDTDVGELKRLVTVMLQEIEQWPDTGLLLAATNHPDLIDSALWRRFDSVFEFSEPDKNYINEAIVRFLANDVDIFKKYIPVFSLLFEGYSFALIERAINEIRRANLLESLDTEIIVKRLVERESSALDRQGRQKLAIELVATTSLSQHEVSRITGVTRDTIRKYTPIKM